jgi:hypothetical protein
MSPANANSPSLVGQTVSQYRLTGGEDWLRTRGCVSPDTAKRTGRYTYDSLPLAARESRIDILHEEARPAAKRRTGYGSSNFDFGGAVRPYRSLASWAGNKGRAVESSAAQNRSIEAHS